MILGPLLLGLGLRIGYIGVILRYWKLASNLLFRVQDSRFGIWGLGPAFGGHHESGQEILKGPPQIPSSGRLSKLNQQP